MSKHSKPGHSCFHSVLQCSTQWGPRGSAQCTTGQARPPTCTLPRLAGRLRALANGKQLQLLAFWLYATWGTQVVKLLVLVA